MYTYLCNRSNSSKVWSTHAKFVHMYNCIWITNVFFIFHLVRDFFYTNTCLPRKNKQQIYVIKEGKKVWLYTAKWLTGKYSILTKKWILWQYYTERLLQWTLKRTPITCLPRKKTQQIYVIKKGTDCQMEQLNLSKVKSQRIHNSCVGNLKVFYLWIINVLGFRLGWVGYHSRVLHT